MAASNGTPPMSPRQEVPPPRSPWAYLETKTPVGILQEILVKKYLTIDVKFTEFPGPIQNRFHCKITTNVKEGDLPWEGVGEGACKKDAKQEAALTMLRQKVDEKTGWKLSYTTPRSKAESLAETLYGGAAVAPPASENPISELNILCSRARIPSPEYEEGPVVRTTNHSVFTLFCQLNARTVEIGQGPNKKYAKRVAATKVLRKVKLAIQDPSLAPELFPESEQEDLCQKLASLRVSKKPSGLLDEIIQSINI